METDFFDICLGQCVLYASALRQIGGTGPLALADKLDEAAAFCQAEIDSGRRRARVETIARQRLADLAARFEGLSDAKKAAFLSAVRQREALATP